MDCFYPNLSFIKKKTCITHLCMHFVLKYTISLKTKQVKLIKNV
jgi:hypothetical protein